MTIGEIAKMAGVSNAAVSRYFNNGYISEEKRARIHEVVEATGYRPSIQAQMLRTKKTRTVGVIVPKMASTTIGSVVEGILRKLDESGYQMLLAVTQESMEKEIAYLKSLGDQQVDGIILLGSVFTPEHKRQLKKMKLPLVIAGQRLDGYNCVYHDDYHAMYDMTKYFIENGRQRLGYLSTIWQDVATGKERYRGFSDALREYGMGKQRQQFEICDFTIQSGYEKVQALLNRYGDLDGIICATDEIAIGALKYLQQQKIRVPEQILLSGHGDSEMVGVVTPPLLTVRYSYELCGEQAVEMLLDKIKAGGEDNTDEIVPKEVKLDYELIDPTKF